MKSRKNFFLLVPLLVAALSIWWCFRPETKPAPTNFKTPAPVKTWEQHFNFNLPLTGISALKTQFVNFEGFVIWKNISTAPPKELQDKVLDDVMNELADVSAADLQEDKSAQARSRLETKMRDALNIFLKSEKADFEIDSVRISEFKLSTS